jgi:hypothetical protein
MPLTFNGKHHYNLPPMAGSPETQAQYQQADEKARAKQTCRFAVAPGCGVHTGHGEDKHEGDEVTKADYNGNPHTLRELTRLGVLIEVSKEELHRRQGWSDATHRVNPEGKALTASKDSARGILSPGEPCRAADFEHKAVPEHQHVDRYGRVVTAPAKEADDGTETLRNLIAKGYIIERPKRLGQKAAK